ncbi:hypothetical protein Pcinc_029275 [Petrolisthes cinctipes]|uniref:Inorganic phosphate cotransporter n=1 Tax=Petrolisthes cinctipes TaxID=88211 RepID=A0AAE1F192_PETCI|nr:hypothetical protein Pcinc_029275 [Petrolisthes cinctipes]
MSLPQPPLLSRLYFFPDSTSQSSLPNLYFPASTSQPPLPSLLFSTFFPVSSFQPPFLSSLHFFPASTSGPPLPSLHFQASTFQPPLPSLHFPASTYQPPLPDLLFPASTSQPPLPSLLFSTCTRHSDGDVQRLPNQNNGYVEVVGGRLAERYGAKWVFGVSILSGGVANLLTPTAARLHYGVLIALRALQGVFQGITIKYDLVVFLAIGLGTAVTLPMCGIVIDAAGWPAAFYVTGICSLLWCVLWFSVIHSTPAQHPRISQEELQYIENALRSSGTNSNRPPHVPWKSMATSLPFWAIIISEMCNSYGISIIRAQLPTFMKNIFGFSIKMNGLLSALPFLSNYLGGITTSLLSSWILKHGYLSIINTRRVFSAISQLVPALMVVALINVGCNTEATIAIFCIALFFNGAITSGHIVNHHDIAPNFSGTLFGISNSFYNIVAFIAPVVTGMLTDGQQTLDQWRKAFWICVPLYVVGVVFFVFFLSGSVQPWNSSEPKNPPDTPSTNRADTGVLSYDSDITVPQMYKNILRETVLVLLHVALKA